MLHLSMPIWMFTATAMAIPLLIHLWNIRKGRRLKIGSLALITETVQKTARQIRITEWLLLLLRCLMILLLALFLSRPVWRARLDGGKGWVLVPREEMQQLYPAFQQEIDSLLAAGHSFHYFNYPFTETSPGSQDEVPGDETAYWRRLAQLNAMLPKETPVHIYTTASLKQFAGNKPAIGLQVVWKALPMQKAADSIFTDTASFTATVYYAPAYREDANYVTAALEALRTAALPGLRIEETTDHVITNEKGWVFWLSDEKPETVRPHLNYIVYAAGEAKQTNTALLSAEATSNAGTARIHKRTTAKPATGLAVWKDGYGNAVAAQENGRIALYTRFHPEWTNIVWDASFPEWILQLMGKKDTTAWQDAHIDISQLRFIPATVAGKHAAKEIALDNYVWMLLLICIVAERWVSLKPKKDGV